MISGLNCEQRINTLFLLLSLSHKHTADLSEHVVFVHTDIKVNSVLSFYVLNLNVDSVVLSLINTQHSESASSLWFYERVRDRE